MEPHGRVFKVECIFLRERWSWGKSRNEVLFQLTPCTASLSMKTEHIQLSSQSLMLLCSILLFVVICLICHLVPFLCIFQLRLPLLNYQTVK